MNKREAYKLGMKMGTLTRQIQELNTEILDIMKDYDEYEKDYINALILVAERKRRESSQLQEHAEKLYKETVDTSK